MERSYSMDLTPRTRRAKLRGRRTTKIIRKNSTLRYNYHSFKRYASATAFALMRSNTNTEATYSMNFKLSDLPNYAEFTALFDQYRLRTVVVTFRAKQSQGVLMPYDASGPSDQLIIPTVWAAKDYDDDAATSVAALKEYTGAKNWPATRDHTIVVHPKMTPLVHDGVTPGYSAANPSQWIDCAYPDVPHYGLKATIDLDGLAPVADESTVPHFYIERQILYYIDFKNTR